MLFASSAPGNGCPGSVAHPVPLPIPATLVVDGFRMPQPVPATARLVAPQLVVRTDVTDAPREEQGSPSTPPMPMPQSPPTPPMPRSTSFSHWPPPTAVHPLPTAVHPVWLPLALGDCELAYDAIINKANRLVAAEALADLSFSSPPHPPARRPTAPCAPARHSGVAQVPIAKKRPCGRCAACLRPPCEKCVRCLHSHRKQVCVQRRCDAY